MRPGFTGTGAGICTPSYGPRPYEWAPPPQVYAMPPGALALSVPQQNGRGNIGYKTPQLSAAVYVADAAAPRPYETNSNAQAPPPQVYEMPAPSAYTTAGYTRPLPSAYAYDPRQPMPQQRMAVSESSLNPES